MGFNESQHPRVPAGSSEGGQFASKGFNFVGIAGRDEAALRSHVKNMGGSFGREEAARMAGALPGAQVHIGYHSEGLDVEVTNFDADGKVLSQAHRILYIKDKTIYNGSLDVKDKGKGLGAKMLLQQVREGTRNGFEWIELTAGGSGQERRAALAKAAARPDDPDAGWYLNGYYTWPRLGFLPKEKSKEKSFIRKMSTPAGRKDWLENGTEFNAYFDMRRGSISRRVLAGYAREKGL